MPELPRKHNALGPPPAGPAAWAPAVSNGIPPPPRRLGFRRLPWPLVIGGGAAVVVGLIALVTHWPLQPTHPPHYGELAVLFSPLLLWAWKIRQEALVLKYGDACIGQITSTTESLPLKDRVIQVFSQTRLPYVTYQYVDKSGVLQTGGKLDWWLRQRVGMTAVVFTDPHHPRRSVLHGCCAVHICGLDL